MTDPHGKESTPQPPTGGTGATRDLWTHLTRLGAAGLAVLLTVNACLTSWHLQHQADNSREHLFWAICHDGGTPESRRDAFLALVADGNSIWTAARLNKLDLDGVDLAGCYLGGTIFDGSRLVGAQLMRADLLGASLKTVDLSRASLQRAQMEEVLALRAKLDEAKFYEANLQSATLEQVHAHKANFVKADLSGSYLYMADFTGSSFAGANMTDANLEAAIFRDADLSLTIMQGVRLIDADFSGANWWQAQGLTKAQIDELSAKFPPEEDAPASRRNDYQRWLQNRKP